MKKILLAAFVGALLSAASAARAQIVVHVAPPPPVVEQVPAVPAEHPSWAWQPGYYRWDADANRYVWVPGHYLEPPYERAHWVEGHWVERDGGWTWVEGHWSH